METTTPQEEVREESSSQVKEAFFSEESTLKSKTILFKGDEVGFDGYKLAEKDLRASSNQLENTALLA
eukprot:snap_masked-scaffold_74-processed-gene-0.38-mRNA-1 protein AED:1.00 eAED:1.00 QI:0/-1/0/0/-1/1/1/0/67